MQRLYTTLITKWQMRQQASRFSKIPTCLCVYTLSVSSRTSSSRIIAIAVEKRVRKLGGNPKLWPAGKYNSLVVTCQSRADDVSKQNLVPAGATRDVDLDSPGLFALYFPSNDIFGAAAAEGGRRREAPSLLRRGPQVEQAENGNTRQERHGAARLGPSTDLTDVLTDNALTYSSSARTHARPRTVFGVVGTGSRMASRSLHGRRGDEA